MPAESHGWWPRLGAGVLVFWNSRFLLIRRRYQPYQGRWTPPGGKVEHGETVLEAAKRELFEECSIVAARYTFVDYFEFIENIKAPFPYHYVVVDFLAEYESGDIQGGDDVEDAAWFHLWDLPALETTPETRQLVDKAIRLRSET